MNNKFSFYILKLLVIVSIILSNHVQAANTTLKVALYPYVPRIAQFETAIQTQWNQVQPEVDLVFDHNWDGGYDKTPPDDVDVFVFDAMFFEHFLNKGYLEPMKAKEIANLDDFLDYAISGVQANGKYYAIPQLGCANILFYQTNDSAIANAKSISDLKSVLNQCSYTSQIPPDVRGLMIDMQGGTTNASFYLDIAHSMDNQFPFPLPSSQEDLKPAVIQAMRDLLAMASFQGATQSPPKDYGRARWFSKGYGRVLIGFTEHMSVMSAKTRNSISFKPLPRFANDHPPVFYADVIAVNPKSNHRGTRNLAVQLANVMAATETMIASIGSDKNNPYPQYLMATRPSVFTALGKDFPIYQDMYSMVKDSHPIMFKLSSNSKEWLSNMKSIIRSKAQDQYPCGCDQVAKSLIPNNNAAKDICTVTCADYGGWNGQWTNQLPAAPSGSSVCGCNACTTPQ